MRRLLIVVNDASFFLSHRLPIAEGAKRSGYDVHVATGGSETSMIAISNHGLRHHPIPVSRRGRNPIREAKLLFALFSLFRQVRPDIVHLVTIKPVIYGSLAARLSRVPAIIAAISGLGITFHPRSAADQIVKRIVVFAYRMALRHPNVKVIFQNPTDKMTMEANGAVTPSQGVLIKGSGVDLAEFSPREVNNAPPIVLMASRLIWDKGVGEYVAAARQINATRRRATFLLVGNTDEGNPRTVPDQAIEAWKQEGVVECLGFRSDMAELIGSADVVVLPSYYGEGLPKVLIEAAASGKPVITTHTPGCRDAVVPGVSGTLVPARDVASLVSAIEELLDDKTLRQKYGTNARRYAEREFSIQAVVAGHLSEYDALLSQVSG